MTIKKDSLPPGHSWVETEDGSFTLFSERFKEACHSVSGARNETLLHYIQGCRIEEKSTFPTPLSILEVGFGLGLGFLTTYQILLSRPTEWSFLSLELDRDLVEWFRLENQLHPFLSKLTWSKTSAGEWLEAKSDGRHLCILIGDARIALPQYLKSHPTAWNAIYQDAFSPKKNPRLWTVEWFDLLKSHASMDVILSTYSSSSSIRKSLIEAGWKLTQGEKFGPKRTSTRARLQGETDPQILLHLERSPVSALRDDNVEESLKK